MHFNGDLETMHEFSVDDGSLPSRSLVLADDGNLYGSTHFGWLRQTRRARSSESRSNGNLTVLHEFDRTPTPRDELIQASSGDLIGMLGTRLTAVPRKRLSG